MPTDTIKGELNQNQSCFSISKFIFNIKNTLNLVFFVVPFLYKTSHTHTKTKLNKYTCLHSCSIQASGMYKYKSSSPLIYPPLQFLPILFGSENFFSLLYHLYSLHPPFPLPLQVPHSYLCSLLSFFSFFDTFSHHLPIISSLPLLSLFLFKKRREK